MIDFISLAFQGFKAIRAFGFDQIKDEDLRILQIQIQLLRSEEGKIVLSSLLIIIPSGVHLTKDLSPIRGLRCTISARISSASSRYTNGSSHFLYCSDFLETTGADCCYD